MSEDFSQFLPSAELSPQDAITFLSDLTDTKPRKLRKLFQNSKFLNALSDKINEILSAVPQESEERVQIEVEHAWLIKKLESMDTLVYVNPVLEDLRHMEYALEKTGVFQSFLEFENLDKALEGRAQKHKHIVTFLNYLLVSAQRGGEHLWRYCRMFRKVSQLNNGSKPLFDHIKGAVEGFITTREEFEDRVNGSIQHGHYISLEQWQELSSPEESPHDDIQATSVHSHSEIIGYYVTQHIFFEYLRDDALPKVSKFAFYNRKRKQEVYDLLNDVRDILDPNQFIPFFFISPRTVENIYRRNIVTNYDNYSFLN